MLQTVVHFSDTYRKVGVRTGHMINSTSIVITNKKNINEPVQPVLSTCYNHFIDQPGKVANPARGQLNRENEYSPFPVRV